MATVKQPPPVHEKEQPKSIAAIVWTECEKIMLRVFDAKPLPPTFPRNLLMELYVARTILFASFTLGIRAGGYSCLYSPARQIFGSFIVFMFTYVFLPLLGANIAYLFKKDKLTLYEYRVSMIVWAFLCGTFSTISNIHYALSDYGAPNYFMPVLVGLTAHLIGNRFDNNRKALVGLSVGSAVLVSLSMLLMTSGLSIGAFFSLSVCSVNAIVALQLMIYDLVLDGPGASANASMTHVVGVIIIMINFLIVVRLTGTYLEDPGRNDVARSSPLHAALSA
ncbi:Bax inhibitor-1 family protein [Caenorhabditis elegans]|uniref:Bax inhibitor-1 family protein n=1 Tax=Caenorhabditis elegans TaxID=6239 RepID=Q93893_CAEEL|nr:Bax inhibitor-1 family protein [Caenorhabditis elegans]CAB03203.2 Bax inhibitor-1 family protein [Caenorhabditis elegans]|eukprot:NP_502444.2 Uncharacterized protein CELE_M02B1.4 [Caenorhabditis elegans]